MSKSKTTTKAKPKPKPKISTQKTVYVPGVGHVPLKTYRAIMRSQ